jgi:hypothetical protein
MGVKHTYFNICLMEDESGFITVSVDSAGNCTNAHELGETLVRQLLLVESLSDGKLNVQYPNFLDSVQ